MTRTGPSSAPHPLRLGTMATAAALLALAGSAAGAAEPAHASDAAQITGHPADIRPGERLSQWLLRQPDGQQIANPGLAWRIHDEEFAQRHLKNTLLVQLEAWLQESRSEPERSDRERLRAWIDSLPITGRVALGIVDPRWLEANPTEDPVLGAGQRLVPSAWPLRSVAVVLPDGRLCRVAHEPGRNVLDYLAACGLQDQADWAWLAQPDGRTSRMGVAPWNAGPVDEPAPGAWLWAAPRRMRLLDGLSEGMIKFLATQGPSPQEDGASAASAAPGQAARLPESAAAQPRTLDVSANDWGEIGLLQTPTARMEQAGNLRATLSNVYPYSRLSFMFQPFDWMEGGFRYSSISNRIYGITDQQSYKDKSIDLKLRLLKESAYVPQVALGFRDFGGTGLFSSEYLVASKRWNDFDFSLGIGWGYMARSGNIRNPFRLFGDRFATRPTDFTTGQASLSTLFRGPAALFGGVQWRTPWDPLTLKIEYDGNDYRSEPFDNRQRRRSPINVGLSYRVSPGVVLSAGFERGDKVMVGLSLSSNLSRSSMPKVLDPPLPRLGPQAPLHPPGWAVTAAAIEEQTEWTVTHIAPQGEALHVWATEADATYRDARAQRAAAVLHAAAPENIHRFVLHFSERGLPSHARVIERAEWVTQRLVPLPPRQARVPASEDYGPASTHATPDDLPASVRAPAGAGEAADAAGAGAAAATVAAAGSVPQGLPGRTGADGVWTRQRDRFTWGVGPYFSPIVGGPDAFVLYQLGLQASAEYRFSERTWLSGAVNMRLVDNFDKFTYTAPSNLPRVRTYQREYVTSARVTVPNLQLTHVGQFARDHYYSVYGGLLESMFAGVGAEYLYRPWGSRLAFGVDINRVRQRGFKQDLSLRDYEVTTGHATVYWDTGWHGVIARIAAGQYLAGDRGVTLSIARRFDNGLVMGAYATKTNVSAEQFGEGSFDKGIYISVPLDALLPRSTKFSVGFQWNPLTRDGGAPLARSQQLYELTSGADRQAFRTGPPQQSPARSGDNLLNFENRPR